MMRSKVTWVLSNMPCESRFCSCILIHLIPSMHNLNTLFVSNKETMVISARRHVPESMVSSNYEYYTAWHMLDAIWWCMGYFFNQIVEIYDRIGNFAKIDNFIC
jgi:hypothetical protein